MAKYHPCPKADLTEDITQKEGEIIKTVSQLNTNTFSDLEKFVSIGRIRPDIISSIIEKYPEFSEKLSSETDIIFWSDRIKHTERHRKDFSSPEEYEHCFRHIPDIIQKPDYISIHPNKDSISFIKDYSDHTSVAIRVSMDGKLAYRTMYPLRESQLDNYIKNGRAWKCQ
ncbi:MAG: PBECR2 nuclease fold domain-containing protein [Lachnospiraceae bacterium]|nr:PBECR2 nuclease fold domain-containing protein [Lachnospiraceae bacterium]